MRNKSGVACKPYSLSKDEPFLPLRPVAISTRWQDLNRFSRIKGYEEASMLPMQTLLYYLGPKDSKWLQTLWDSM